MKKKYSAIFTALLVFSFSYFAFNSYVNFDTMSAVLFLLIVVFLVVRNRKMLDFHVLVGIRRLPLVYAVLWKTKFGLELMERIAAKYRELVKLIGYCFVGFGFFGMVFISINIAFLLFNLFVSPKEASQGVALVLPLTHIPGIGYLSFWHFLITIFITVLIHEFAHGIVARAHKVPVKSSGLGVFSLLLPLFPLAFVEPDEKKLQKERDIVQYSIFAAGPIVNIIFAMLILLLTAHIIVPIENAITHPVGFSFSGLMQDYPAEKAGMRPGMVITEVNGVKVLEYEDFSRTVGELKPGQQLTLRTDNGTFTIIAKPSPDNPDKGYIGILDIRNERRINGRYKAVGGAFFWLRGLVKWLYFLNLIIGLMNLLPLMITDGGRMLKTALEKVCKDGERANNAWMLISAIFIFTLFFALLVRYAFEFFSFIGLS
jgi:membrane-associated protease RseP (regulator of RpoE activity)